MDIGSTEGPIPGRFDQLFGCVTPFRSLVYSTPDARVVDDTRNVVGEVDMSLTKGASGDGVTEKRCVSRTVGPGQSGAIGSARGNKVCRSCRPARVPASPYYTTVGGDVRVLRCFSGGQALEIMQMTHCRLRKE